MALGAMVSAGGTASASSLECGNAYIDHNSTYTSAFIVHSCTGTGTVVYTIGRLAQPDIQMSHYFQSPGASIRKPVTGAPGDTPFTSVSWEEK
jgi:hypothetical protein